MSQKAVFLDRDDTLINDPGYLDEPDKVALLPGAIEALIQFKKMGYLVVVVTNQSAIARGLLTEKKLEQIHQRLHSVIMAGGGSVDGIYYCPYHPEGTVAEYTRDSSLRKPGPGMLLKAADEMAIDLEQSWMVGDRLRDVEAGRAAGCHTILVDVPGKTREANPDGPQPDRKAVNLREAVNIIRMYEFHQKAQAAKKAVQENPPTETPAAAEPITPAKTEPVVTPAVEVKPIPIQKPQAVSPAADPLPEATKPEPKPAVAAEEKPAPLKFHTTKPVPKPKPSVSEETSGDDTHHLLQEILQRVTSSGRSELYEDFSIHKLLAGMGQVVAIGCLVFSLCLWLSPKVGTEPVLILIGYAIALQLVVIALLMMHDRNQ